ncbi:MAG: glycosyltransferase family 39 protein [Candidatus Woesearchaeota archaeon]
MMFFKKKINKKKQKKNRINIIKILFDINKKLDKKKIFYLILFFLFLIVFFIRLFPFRVSYGWDEAVYLQHAEYFFNGKENYNEFHIRPIFLSVIIAFFYNFYHNFIVPKIIISFFGALSFIFMFLIGKELYNEKIGFLSSLFYGFMPFLVFYSKNIMTEIPSMAFFLIAIYLLIIYFKSQKIKNHKKIIIFFSGVFFGLSFLTRFSTLILFIVLLLYLLLNTKKNFYLLLKKIIILSFGFFITLIPYLIWLYFKTGNLNIFINANKAVSDLNEPFYFYFANFFNAYSFFLSITLFILIIIYLKILINRLNKINKENKQKNHKKKNIIEKQDFILFFWFFLYIVYISTIPHKEIRYLIPAIYPLFFLSGKSLYLIESYLSNLKKNLGFIFLLIFIFLFFIFSKNVFDIEKINTYESDEIKVSKFLIDYATDLKNKDNKVNNFVIYSRFNHPVYALYTNFNVVPIYQKDFYKYYKRYMKEKGFFIYYKDLGDENEDWLINNKDFKKILEKNNIVVFEYSIS